MSAAALGNDARLDDLLARMREAILHAARGYGEETSRVEQVIAEAAPFVESALRAWHLHDQPDSDALFREARSYAWLLAYRLGDQSFAPAMCAAFVPAWCNVSGQPHDHPWSRALHALVLDGYAKGREDHARAEFQQKLGAQLPVLVLDGDVVLAHAAGPIESDAARVLVERAAQTALRSDGRAVILELSGLAGCDDAVAAELFALVSAAKMLGVRCVFAGASEAVRAGLERAARGEALEMASDARAAITEIVSGTREGLLARWVRRLRGR